MVAVQMSIATSPDKVTDLQITDLRDHMRQQSIAGNIKWYTQKFYIPIFFHNMLNYMALEAIIALCIFNFAYSVYLKQNN
jgi:hypothetical protein